MNRRDARMRLGAIGLAVLITASMCGMLLIDPGAARAQPQAPASVPAAEELDPAVAEALRGMAAALAGAPALAVHLTSLRETAVRPGSDQQIMLGATVAVGIERPDRLAALVGAIAAAFASGTTERP